MTRARVTVDIRDDWFEEPAGAAREAVLSALHDAEPMQWLTRSRTTDTSLVQVPGQGLVVRKCWRWPRLGERLRYKEQVTA